MRRQATNNRATGAKPPKVRRMAAPRDASLESPRPGTPKPPPPAPSKPPRQGNADLDGQIADLPPDPDLTSYQIDRLVQTAHEDPTAVGDVCEGLAGALRQALEAVEARDALLRDASYLIEEARQEEDRQVDLVAALQCRRDETLLALEQLVRTAPGLALDKAEVIDLVREIHADLEKEITP